MLHRAEQSCRPRYPETNLLELLDSGLFSQIPVTCDSYYLLQRHNISGKGLTPVFYFLLLYYHSKLHSAHVLPCNQRVSNSGVLLTSFRQSVKLILASVVYILKLLKIHCLYCTDFCPVSFPAFCWF